MLQVLKRAPAVESIHRRVGGGWGCRGVIGAVVILLGLGAVGLAELRLPPLGSKKRLRKRCPWVRGMDGCSFGGCWHPPAAERLAGKRSRRWGSSPARRLRGPSSPLSRGCLALLPALVPFWDGAMLPPWCRIGLINETAVTSWWRPRVKAGCIYAVCHPSLSAFFSPFLLLRPLPPQLLRSISVIALPSAITLLVDFQELALPGRCHPFPPLP